MKNTIHTILLSNSQLNRDKSKFTFLLSYSFFNRDKSRYNLYRDISTLVPFGTNNNKVHYSTVAPISKKACEAKKTELLKNLPGVFKDMSKIKKEKDKYLATTKELKPFSLNSLNGILGVYMITNIITKKFYIGMSTNLKNRLEDYISINRLNSNRSTRIHKALLKYGFENFSITILQLDLNKKNTSSAFWREREDFFIKIFKPQYNIKRSQFNMDTEFMNNRKIKYINYLPTIVKNLLDKCLDSKYLDYNLVEFLFNSVSKNKYYYFAVTTPKGWVKLNSSGWQQGSIYSKKGWEDGTWKDKKISLLTIINCYELIDKEKLAKFYPEEGSKYVSKMLRIKLNALKALYKKENDCKTPTLNQKSQGKTGTGTGNYILGGVTKKISGVTGHRCFSTSTKLLRKNLSLSKNNPERNKKINDKDYLFKSQKTLTLDLNNREVKNTIIDLRKDKKRLVRPTKIIILKLGKDYLQVVTVKGKPVIKKLCKKYYRILRLLVIKKFVGILTLLYFFFIQSWLFLMDFIYILR